MYVGHVVEIDFVEILFWEFFFLLFSSLQLTNSLLLSCLYEYERWSSRSLLDYPVRSIWVWRWRRRKVIAILMLSERVPSFDSCCKTQMNNMYQNVFLVLIFVIKQMDNMWHRCYYFNYLLVVISTNIVTI